MGCPIILNLSSLRDKLKESLIRFTRLVPLARGAEFPSLWEGLGEGLRRVLCFVFEGGVNVDVKHSNTIFIIETALTAPPIK